MVKKNKVEALGFKVEVKEYEHITKESDGESIYSRNSTRTERTIEEIEVLGNGDMAFNVGGDFSLEQLKSNNNVVYMYYIESDSHDSFGIDENKFIDFVEVFLTEEKANNLKKAVNIIEEAIKLKKYSGNNKVGLKDKLDKLNEKLLEIGVEKDLNKDTQREPLSILKYKGENGTEKTVYIDYSDKSFDDVTSMVVRGKELIEKPNSEINKVKSKNKLN